MSERATPPSWQVGLALETDECQGTDEEVSKLAGLNVLRAFRAAEGTAARLQKERPASDATIEELDGPTKGMKPAG